MLRFVNVCLVLGLLALAYVIYEVKYEARALDVEIAQLRQDIEVERDAVAVLRAEWSLLNRPERIERLAEKYLKVAPAKPSQLVTLETLQDGDFNWTTMVAKSDALKRPGAGVKPVLVNTVKPTSPTAPAFKTVTTEADLSTAAVPAKP